MSNSSDLILENLLDAVIIVNQQGIILYANRAAEQLFQKENSFLKGQNFGLSVTALELQQIQIVQKGKNLSIEMLATDIAWQGEQAILMSLRDVTEKAKLELRLQKSNRLLTKKTAALKKVNEALEKSNDSLERFAHVTSHDLKEPLRKIRVFSGRLTSEFENQLPDKSLVYINKIVQSADRLLAMVDGILSYSSLLGMDESMETVDLNEVIRHVKSDLELMINQRQARIEHTNLPKIWGEPVLFHQLFYNLVLNSLKFSRKSEPPLIKISHKNLSVGGEKMAEIVVKDNGIGFEPEEGDLIFQAFRQLNGKEYFEGTGLGLSLCKQIVDRHRGQIRAAGKKNQGAEFTILLPLQEAPGKRRSKKKADW